MSELVSIDGSQGEGGGQIIRTALTLSLVTGRPFEVAHVRAGRKRPGLLRQHLTAVHAAREICGGSVSGAGEGSRHLIFTPGPVQTRGFRFAVGSAGSAILVAQTILPALMIADGISSIEIEGGTHNMEAPPYDFLEQVYLPVIGRMGPRISSEILAWGFYPAGGGLIRISIEPSLKLAGIELMESGGTPQGTITALVSRLPEAIGERECQLIRRHAGWKTKSCTVRKIGLSPGPGNVVMIRLDSPNVTEMFTAFGKQGIRAEQVAMQAWKAARDYLANEVPVGEHLCDQLLLPGALAARNGAISRFLTGPLSMHSLTQIDIIKRFLDVIIRREQLSARQIAVTIAPALADVQE
jgi:RNA 3'-terminal phosphate cyclase (ATP)